MARSVITGAVNRKGTIHEVETIRAGGDLLVHLHIAEKTKRTPPGTAGDDFTPYFRALKEIGYDGLLSIECRWDDMAGQLSRAVRTLNEQFTG